MKGKTKYVLFFAIASAVLILDQWTKHLIHSSFKLGQSLVMMPSFFDLTYLGNRGAAFSFLDSAPPSFREPFFLIVPLIALTAILIALSRMKQRQILNAVALSLIFGGALGNLVDRLQLGYVVDFLYFHWKTSFYWPAFNVADSCIVIGVGLLLCHSFIVGRPPSEEVKPVITRRES